MTDRFGYGEIGLDINPCRGCEDYEAPDRCKSNGGCGKPQTNADRIRAMTDEELAIQIAWPYIASPPWCAEHTTCPYISEDPTPCDKCAFDWLKSPVEVDNGT